MALDVVHSLFLVYTLAIIVTVVASWIPTLHSTPGLRELTAACSAVAEPYLALWRRVIPTVGAGGTAIDLSPILAILALQLLEGGATSLLVSAGV
jgi:uncharacterized protein YggT (Ycf19 family)